MDPGPDQPTRGNQRQFRAASHLSFPRGISASSSRLERVAAGRCRREAGRSCWNSSAVQEPQQEKAAASARRYQIIAWASVQSKASVSARPRRRVVKGRVQPGQHVAGLGGQRPYIAAVGRRPQIFGPSFPAFLPTATSPWPNGSNSLVSRYPSRPPAGQTCAEEAVPKAVPK